MYHVFVCLCLMVAEEEYSSMVIILSKLFLFTYYYNDRNYSMRNFAADIFVGSSYRDFMDESCLATPTPHLHTSFDGLPLHNIEIMC